MLLYACRPLLRFPMYLLFFAIATIPSLKEEFLPRQRELFLFLPYKGVVEKHTVEKILNGCISMVEEG
ncbi:hypothetical protein JCM21714_3831 [Gracilibacillus boraciitolerans JCM 21714]|uniref:Uncharacterized protein n=2 Tax=Gracilibacillus boraciitolerans TaxID=307521 RepID=W4VP83_9BACI|nr:hypothetical protein JCM21714_3831 [Gracilibacillus boraciitolerans JCM 21714]